MKSMLISYITGASEKRLQMLSKKELKTERPYSDEDNVRLFRSEDVHMAS